MQCIINCKQGGVEDDKNSGGSQETLAGVTIVKHAQDGNLLPEGCQGETKE